MFSNRIDHAVLTLTNGLQAAFANQWERCAASCNRNRDIFINEYDAEFDALRTLYPRLAKDITGEEFKKIFYEFRRRLSELKNSFCKSGSHWSGEELHNRVYQAVSR
jgi:hypothetical protein